MDKVEFWMFVVQMYTSFGIMGYAVISSLWRLYANHRKS